MAKHRCIEPDAETEEGDKMCKHNCTVDIPNLGGHSPRYCVYYGQKARWISVEFEKIMKEQDPDWNSLSLEHSGYEKVK